MKPIQKIFFTVLSLGILSGCTESTPPQMMQKFTSEKTMLGEGPWWDADKQKLVLIDIDGKALLVIDADGKKTERFPLSGQPGTVVPTDKGNYLLALGNRIVIYNHPQGVIDTIHTAPFSTNRLRFNDGKVAPDGSLWVGTVECQDYAKPIASLYKMNTAQLITKLNHVTISNGISWSPDGKTMYYIDSPTKKVKAYDYSSATGDIANERIIIITPEEWGTPDGCCIDSDGNLWVAQWGGACVALWNTKTGELIRKIDVPAKNVTAVALGGEDLKTLFITTASIAMEQDDIHKYPDAGHIFATTVDTPGILRTKWTEN